MHTFLLSYRIKLSYEILSQDTFYNFLNNEYSKDEYDYEIRDVYGNICKPFSNSSLKPQDCFENTLIITHDTPVNPKDALNGEFEFYGDLYFRSYFISSYIICESAETDTLYIVKYDSSSVLLLESYLPSLMQKFMAVCQEMYDFEDLSYKIKSQTISEDGKVVKVKLDNFYQLKENKDEKAAKLNRIFPS